MRFTEDEAVSHTRVESSCAEASEMRQARPGSDQGAVAASIEDLMEIVRHRPLAADRAVLEREVERLHGVAELAEKQIAASERRVAELEALCQARHAGLQIVLAQLQFGEQLAKEAERALTGRVLELSVQLRAAERANETLTRSMSWRCTAPFRWIAGWAPARSPRPRP